MRSIKILSMIVFALVFSQCNDTGNTDSTLNSSLPGNSFSLGISSFDASCTPAGTAALGRNVHSEITRFLTDSEIAFQSSADSTIETGLVIQFDGSLFRLYVNDIEWQFIVTGSWEAVDNDTVILTLSNAGVSDSVIVDIAFDDSGSLIISDATDGCDDGDDDTEAGDTADDDTTDDDVNVDGNTDDDVTTDTDADDDGVDDDEDDFPTDDSEDTDTDGDGTGDNADTDDDGDGVSDDEDAFPQDSTETTDTDGDGTGDNADTDDDGDGIADEDEVDTTTDTDGDGVVDSEDAFDDDATETTDTDGDGTGNNADTDDDGDGVLDENDSDPLDSSAGEIDADSDGLGVTIDPDDDQSHAWGYIDADDGIPVCIAEQDEYDYVYIEGTKRNIAKPYTGASVTLGLERAKADPGIFDDSVIQIGDYVRVSGVVDRSKASETTVACGGISLVTEYGYESVDEFEYGIYILDPVSGSRFPGIDGIQHVPFDPESLGGFHIDLGN